MNRFVTFVINLAGDAPAKIVRGSVRAAPDAAVLPRTAFQWKVSCNRAGEVVVREPAGKKHTVVAVARWTDGALAEHQQKGGVPTAYQWRLVEVAVAAALAQLPPEDESVPEGGDDRATDAELELLRPTPAEVLAETPSDFVTAARREKAQLAARTRLGRIIGVVVSLFIVVGIAVPIGVCVHRQGTPVVPRPDQLPRATYLPLDESTLSTVVATIDAAPPDLAAVIAAARPVLMRDEGLEQLAQYAGWTWAEVDVPAETSTALIEKDPEAALGKRLCTEGVIQRIERRDVGTKKTFIGTLRTDDGDSVAFVAVGSTGDLVKRSRAKLCGVATGMADGAPRVFGVFDLPETRSPQVEQ